MQQDTRRITVAHEHLTSAYNEISLAQNNDEQSMAEQAVRRALDHLELASGRLEHERPRTDRGPIAVEIERAYIATRQAWQGVHDLLNDWPDAWGEALSPISLLVQEAIDATGRLFTPTAAGESSIAA